jgi:peroxiredoxin
MSIRILAVFLVLPIALLGTSCADSSPAQPQGVSVGNRARDFTLESLNGNKVSLSDYRGQVVLVNLWATWCPPCQDEIPDLEAVYQARQDDGLVVLGVNVGESRQAVAPFVAELGITYPILLDTQSQLMDEYRVLGLPISILVDREGIIRERHTGGLTAEQLEGYLAEVLPSQ